MKAEVYAFTVLASPVTVRDFFLFDKNSVAEGNAPVRGMFSPGSKSAALDPKFVLNFWVLAFAKKAESEN